MKQTERYNITPVYKQINKYNVNQIDIYDYIIWTGLGTTYGLLDCRKDFQTARRVIP